MITSNGTTFIGSRDHLLARGPLFDFTVYTLGWTHTLFFLYWREGMNHAILILKYLTLHKQQRNPKSYWPFVGLNIKFWRNVWKRGWSASFPSDGALQDILRHAASYDMIWYEVTLHSFVLYGRGLKLDKRIRINSSARLTECRNSNRNP
jgi:hypothetical protein